MDILARFDANYGSAVLVRFGGIIECLLSAMLRYDKYCRRDLFMALYCIIPMNLFRILFLGISLGIEYLV
jgi:hypothetical protein